MTTAIATDATIARLPSTTTPACDLEAERAVLGSVFRDSSALVGVSEWLDPADFYSSAHRRIYVAMLATLADGQSIDELTIKHTMEACGSLDQAGGFDYLRRLGEETPTSAHALGYARIVRNCSDRRSIARGEMPRPKPIASTVAADDPRSEHLKWAREAIAAAAPKPTELWPQVETWGEVEEQTLLESKWLVRNIVLERAVVAIGGQPKATKTWFGIDMLLGIACGGDIVDRFPTEAPPAHVVIFCAEDDKVDVRRRLRAFAKGRNLSQAQMAQVLRLVHIIPRQRLDLCDEETLVRFAAAIHMAIPEGERLGAIMLDPLIDVTRVEDENKASEMKRAADRFRILRDIFQCCVVFVHHMIKAGGDRGTQRRAGQALRGSSSLWGAVDGVIGLQDVNEEECSCNVSVQLRAGKSAHAFSMRLVIDDDAAGKAYCATWETADKDVLCPKQGKRAPTSDDLEARKQDREGRIVEYLRALKGAPASGNEVCKALGGRRSEIYRSMSDLAAAGVIEDCGHKGFRVST